MSDLGAPTAILVPSVFIDTDFPRLSLPVGPSMSSPTWVHASTTSMSRVSTETDVLENTISAVTVTVPVVDGRSRYASTWLLSAALVCPIAPAHMPVSAVFVVSLTASVPAEVLKMNPLISIVPVVLDSLTTTRPFGLTLLPPSCSNL